MRRVRLWSVMALACAGLLSCVSGSTRVDGEARESVFPTARALLDLSPERSEGSAQTLQGVEFGVTGTADDVESVPRNGDLWFVDAHAAFRGGVALHGWLDIEGLVGLRLNHVELDLETNPFGSSDSSNNFGPTAGVQVTAHATDSLSLYARATASTYFVDAESETYEAGLLFRLSDRVRLMVAHRWWNYEEEDYTFLGLGSVDVDLQTRGFVVGAEFGF